MSYKKRLAKYIFHHKFKLLSSFLFALVFSFIDIIIPYIIGNTIDILSNFINESIKVGLNETYINSIFNEVTINVLIIIGLIVVQVIFHYIFGLIVSMMAELISKDIKNDAFIKLNNVSIKYIDSHSRGDLISRLINDVDSLNLAINSTFKQFYQGFITILFTIGFSFYLNWILALVILVLTPFSFLVSFAVAKRNYKSFKEQAELQGNISSHVVESLNNFEIIKTNNYEEESFNEFKNINDKLFKVGKKAQFYSSITRPCTRIINNTIYSLLCILGTLLCVKAYNDPNNLILGTTCTIGVVSTFLQYANKFGKPFDEMTSCFGQIEEGISGWRRINEILDEEDDFDSGSVKVNGLINDISFNNVCFSYDKNIPLIENFNLTIKKGMHVALVGPTGCGKTTMINLIMRFYDPNRGDISVNDISTLLIKKHELRAHIGLVLQDTWIFKGTILDNIKYGKKDATLDEVIKASKNANAHDFIIKLKDGYNTIIDDDSSLSNGQKQLITIARIFLYNPEIMILDEATSSIDTRSEAKVIKAMDILQKDKTSFVIAHRLSTIVNSDLIIVMKDGHIIETGKHNDLLAKNGFYAELFNSQFEN